MKPRLIFIVGPTASGKTAVALALAPRLKAEIISCDSMQVYRGMDILTSKPAENQLKKVAHHCLGIVSPGKEFNVSLYRARAMRCVNGLLKRGTTPLFAGGTGLYVSVVVDGIFRRRTEDAVFRLRLMRLGKSKVSAFLHERLAIVDPRAAGRIHPNDLKRIARALEVHKTTGKTISELQSSRKGLWDKFDIRIFCLEPERAALYARIDGRVDRMLRGGLVEEVRGLLKKKLSRTAGLAIGIREIKGYLRGEHSLELAVEMMKRNTRRYAKRQLTWFRRDTRVEWIKAGKRATPAKLAALIEKKIRKGR